MKFNSSNKGKIGQSWIKFWSWFNIIPLKKINYISIPYVINNETKLRCVTYYLLYADSLWTDVCNPIR